MHRMSPSWACGRRADSVEGSTRFERCRSTHPHRGDRRAPQVVFGNRIVLTRPDGLLFGADRGLKETHEGRGAPVTRETDHRRNRRLRTGKPLESIASAPSHDGGMRSDNGRRGRSSGNAAAPSGDGEP